MVKNIDFMISADELNIQLKDKNKIVLIDVRQPEEYTLGHIKNAINLPEIFTYLPNGMTTKKEKNDFVVFFQKLFSNAGIGTDEMVVLYEDKYTLKSPRGLTILKYLGYSEEKIKVLDGGYYTWCKKNFITSTEHSYNQKKDFCVNVDENLFVDYHEMLQVIEDDSIVVLDVRDKDEWVGISSSPYGLDFAPKKGRLPNARWIEWYYFITHDMLSVKSLDKIQIELDKKNIKLEDNIVLYCFKGARLSNSYIALRKLGYENIRIYFAGWNEWSRKEKAPIINEMENIDNPLLQENILLKRKLDTLNLQHANLIDFNKYNKEPLFAFNRDGLICSANESAIEKLSHIREYKDIFPDVTSDEIFNMIDNNQEKNTILQTENRYYSLQLRGSRDTNKILVHAFETTKIYTLNKELDEKIKELEQSKKMFTLLLDIAPVMIDSFDTTGKCVLWNKECEKVFGRTIEEINSCSNPLELFYPDPVVQQKALDVMLNEPEKIFREWNPINQKGEILSTMWAHVYLLNGDIINIGYDLTQTKQNEKLISEQSKLVAMGEMIGNIAHQWRQPLSVISTAATGMQMQHEYNCLSDEDLIKSCEAIDKNAQYLSDTIEDFKNFIHGSAEKTIFNLKSSIESVLHLVEGTIKSNNITVLLNMDEKIELNNYENELAQCIINIIQNAKDALIDLPCDDEKFIDISTYFENEVTTIIIKDNAGGIPPALLTKIFEPYFTTKHKSQGTGLGLHMTYNLIQKGMKGTITAKNVTTVYNNRQYTGAEFTITL